MKKNQFELKELSCMVTKDSNVMSEFSLKQVGVSVDGDSCYIHFQSYGDDFIETLESDISEFINLLNVAQELAKVLNVPLKILVAEELEWKVEG